LKNINKIAKLISDAKSNGNLIDSYEIDEIQKIKDAYLLQNSAIKISELNQCGWKIGATSVSAQKHLKVSEPISGPIFKEHIYNSPSKISVFTKHQTHVECEFAFKFKNKLIPKKNKYKLDEIITAIDCLIPVIEIVGCRYKSGFKDMGPIKLISDFGVHVALIKGLEIHDWRDINLIKSKISLYQNDNKVVEGDGSQVLGTPLNVLEWTINHLSKYNKTINNGDIISTGTCTGIIPIKSGDNFIADFHELGKIELDILKN
tara:strand:+ start:226 stop:1008 length:783 start_codon:yes stop_codon:yes gene_type:complete